VKGSAAFRSQRVYDAFRKGRYAMARRHLIALFLLSLALLLVASPTSASCPANHFAWPSNSSYCWRRKYSLGTPAGPGPNIFSPSNVLVTSNGDLRLRIDRVRGSWRSGEAILNRSLGLGDYVWVLRSDPNKMDRNLVWALFLYADDTREIDIEFSRWSDPGRTANAQYTLQPWTRNGTQRFFVIKGGRSTHRIRWSGFRNPGEFRFESWNASSSNPVASFSPTGGNNFRPGRERVRVNFWIYRYEGARGPANNRTNAVAVMCFRFCPLPAGCSPLGVKPKCP
jgi:hypothetical protein